MLNKAVKLDDIDKTIVPLKKFKIIGTIEEGRQHQKLMNIGLEKSFIFSHVFLLVLKRRLIGLVNGFLLLKLKNKKLEKDTAILIVDGAISHTGKNGKMVGKLLKL